jgi:hypothetical protein
MKNRTCCWSSSASPPHSGPWTQTWWPLLSQSPFPYQSPNPNLAPNWREADQRSTRRAPRFPSRTTTMTNSSCSVWLFRRTRVEEGRQGKAIFLRFFFFLRDKRGGISRMVDQNQMDCFWCSWRRPWCTQWTVSAVRDGGHAHGRRILCCNDTAAYMWPSTCMSRLCIMERIPTESTQAMKCNTSHKTYTWDRYLFQFK